MEKKYPSSTQFSCWFFEVSSEERYRTVPLETLSLSFGLLYALKPPRMVKESKQRLVLPKSNLFLLGLWNFCYLSKILVYLFPYVSEKND